MSKELIKKNLEDIISDPKTTIKEKLQKLFAADYGTFDQQSGMEAICYWVEQMINLQPISTPEVIVDPLYEKCDQCENEYEKELHCRECGNNFPSSFKPTCLNQSESVIVGPTEEEIEKEFPITIEGVKKKEGFNRMSYEAEKALLTIVQHNISSQKGVKYVLSQLKTVNKDDLIQYITNLLYAAYTHETDSSKFDKWLEEQMENIDDYLSAREEEK